MSNLGEILTLEYRAVTGEEIQTSASVVGEFSPVPAPLITRLLTLEDATQVHQVTVGRLVGREDRERGYRMIDSEVLAGRRLARQARHGAYPPQLTRLIGYNADSAEPFALFAPYRGEPVDTVAGHLLPAGQRHFYASLLTGLRWLAEAGVAHRGLGPSTVRWDGEQAQITGFSLATVIGAGREAVGSMPWAAPEQRVAPAHGQVTAQDDIWAAGRLMFYVTTGEQLSEREQLADWPALMDLLDGVFGPPELRPTARELLTVRLREPDPVPPGAGADPLIEQGHADFYAARERRRAAAAGYAQPPAEGRAGQSKASRSWFSRLSLVIGVLAILSVAGVSVGMWVH